MFRFFKLGINDLINLLNWTISQLQARAAERLASAAAREEAAKVLMGEAEAERTQAKVAINMADKISKMLK